MANSYGSIFPSNAYLATRYGKTKVTISNTLRKLQEKGYIDLEYRYSGKEIDKRFIYPCLNKLNGVLKKTLTPLKENLKRVLKKTLKIIYHLINQLINHLIIYRTSPIKNLI